MATNNTIKCYFAFAALDILYEFGDKSKAKIDSQEFEELHIQYFNRRDINILRDQMLYHDNFQINHRIEELVDQLYKNLNIQQGDEKIDEDLIERQVELIKKSVQLIQGERGLLARYRISDTKADTAYEKVIQRLEEEITDFKLSDDGFTTNLSKKTEAILDIKKATKNLEKFRQLRKSIVHKIPNKISQDKFSSTIYELEETIKKLDELKKLEKQGKKQAEEQAKILLQRNTREVQATAEERVENQALESGKQKTSTSGISEEERRKKLGIEDKQKTEELTRHILELESKKHSTEQELDNIDTELQKILGTTQLDKDANLEEKISRIKQNITECEKKHQIDRDDIAKQTTDIIGLLKIKDNEGTKFLVANTLRPKLAASQQKANHNKATIDNTQRLLELLKEIDADIKAAKNFNFISDVTYESPRTANPKRNPAIDEVSNFLKPPSTEPREADRTDEIFDFFMRTRPAQISPSAQEATKVDNSTRSELSAITGNLKGIQDAMKKKDAGQELSRKATKRLDQSNKKSNVSKVLERRQQRSDEPNTK
jgi:hypothetical protein